MAQVGIVRRSGDYFREYEVEPGDFLIGICLRYGHRDWRAVYDHPENSAFRTRFPDPNQIDFVNPENLLIPLPGSNVGRSVRGRPVEDYMIARVLNDAGLSLTNTDFQLVGPGSDHISILRNTGSTADIIVVNPPPGDWVITAPDYELNAMTGGSTHAVVDVTTLPTQGGNIDPNAHVKLTRNGIDVISAQRVFYIICPMCGVTFRTVQRPAVTDSNICPNDGFDLSTIETHILANPNSFLSPAVGQSVAPTGLTSRGTESLFTAHGYVTVYWDESRFLDDRSRII